MSPPERREALREAVLKVQTSTQAAIATYWAAQVRRDVDSAQLLLELLNAEIAARASDADDGSEPLDGGEAAGEQAEPSGFAGVWDSSYAPPLILTQSGSSVTGSYNDGQSQMILEITGDRTLEGYWIGTDARKQCETAKAGSIYWGEIELTFREDWSGYTGKWGYCLDDVPDIFWGYWQGDYIRALDAGEE
jgi:hypothetical protein